jgi:hypothetical protein
MPGNSEAHALESRKQFPEENEKIRQTLYPEMKKVKAQGHRVRMVLDRLYINNVEFKHSTYICIELFFTFNHIYITRYGQSKFR